MNDKQICGTARGAHHLFKQLKTDRLLGGDANKGNVATLDKFGLWPLLIVILNPNMAGRDAFCMAGAKL